MEALQERHSSPEVYLGVIVAPILDKVLNYGIQIALLNFLASQATLEIARKPELCELWYKWIAWRVTFDL